MLQKIQTVLLGLAVIGLAVVAVRQEQMNEWTRIIYSVSDYQVQPTDASLELRAIDAWMIRRASDQFEKLPDQEKNRIMEIARAVARGAASHEAYKGGESKLSLLCQKEPTPVWSWMYPQTQTAK